VTGPATALTVACRGWYPVFIRTGEARRRTDTGVLVGWWPEAALLAVFAALTAALAAGALLDLDVAVRDWCLAHRWEPAYLLARGLNQIGSANLLAAICLVIAMALGIRERGSAASGRHDATSGQHVATSGQQDAASGQGGAAPRRIRAAVPVLPILAAFALSYLLIGPVKLLTDRAAPRAPAHDAVELFADPAGWSYPSGHVVNAFIWYQVLTLLLDAWLRGGLPDPVHRLLRVAPPVVVSCTVTYLAFHWVTDVLAALALGLLLDRLMRRIPWPAPIRPERPPVHPRR
jgi:membrane-associated phospholipid phosphatase